VSTPSVPPAAGVARDREDLRAVGRWLALWAAMLALLVLIGGATRLTESGLSITEWKPVSGIVPPLNETAWAAEFARYRQIPQYRQLNPGMTLAEFKTIFLWEYIHRLWARLVGLALALPLLWFGARRRLPRLVWTRLVSLVALLGAQGALGWWMVASGLSERTSVSQYRLAAHLALALVLYAWTVWTAADFLESRPMGECPSDAAPRTWLAAFVALVFATAVSGAFVAGLRAGKIYNSFPLMAGRLVPAEYGQLAPWWKNLFENPSAVQFNHRLIATTTALAALTLWFAYRRAVDARLSRHLGLVLAAALLQASLGISTLLLSVPVWLGVAHQGGAVLLFTAALLALHAACPERSEGAAPQS
jgi:cytochrome c oxidase assembly protein subunit 15